MNHAIEGFRVAPQQRRLYTLQQNSNAYWSCCVIKIRGALHTDHLQSALGSLAETHEMLRTTFHRPPGRRAVLQVINTTGAVGWEVLDLRALSQEQQAEAVNASLAESTRQSPNISREPAIRATLLMLSEQQHTLVIGLPAIYADTWTLHTLVRQLSQVYSTLCQGDEAETEVVQYLQYSEWLNELYEANDEESQAGKAYWQKQQARQLPPLLLPFESKALPTSAFVPCMRSQVIDAELAEHIKAYAVEQGKSLSTILLAAWNTLLWRITGQPEFIVSILTSGRAYDELYDACGLFARYLPIHSICQSSMPFTDFVEQLERSSQEAEEWQDYFGWQVSGEERELPGIGFEFEERPLHYQAGNVTFEVASQQAHFERLKLKLACVATEQGLFVELHYDSSFYPAEALQYMLERYQTLLKSCVAAPWAALETLHLLGESERLFLLPDTKERPQQGPSQECLHQLLERQAAQTPQATALVYEGQQLTYDELNARANQLARRLQRLGVGPEVQVGISIERSIAMVIAFLGVLKAGGAYVPIDPSSPQQRLLAILEDTRAPVLLTQQDLREIFQAAPLEIICLDSDWPAIAQEASENLAVQVMPEHLAYVLFTSGSTGRPKGVCIEHRQILNYLQSIISRLDLPDKSSYGLISTFAADLGNTVLFPSLCTGGCLHIFSQACAADPDALAEYFQQHPIDCLKIVPSHLKALLTAAHPEQVLPRKRLILGGEGTSWDLVKTVQRLAPDCAIINHYGPTEATVGVMTHLLEPGEQEHCTLTLPLSQAIDNVQVYVLDPSLQPVPVGVTGEVYLGGAALARGYLHQPALTSETFIAHPLSAIPGARLYKTGDLARWLPEGSLEILGRMDDQVKFHGYRVELNEIGQALNQHPQIQDSIVLLRKDQHQNDALVAYYLSKQELDGAELRRFLAQRITEETLPNIFIHLTQFPLTANGKIDRQALPTIEEARQKSKQQFVAPRTPAERTLAAIWSKILGIEQIGIHDNFFALGGDSILGIQIIAQANQVGLQLTAKQLFQHQTIADLAAVANAGLVIQAEQGLVIGEAPLTPIQHWFFEQELIQPERWGVAVILEAQQPLDPALVEQSFRYLLQHHDALRLRFAFEDSARNMMIFDDLQAPPFTFIDLSEVPSGAQEPTIHTMLNQLQASLNLVSGPVIQVAFIHCGAHSPARLLFVIHRLVIDGVSWRILLQHFETTYQQLSRGEAIQFTPKTTSLKYWAERLVEHAQSPDLQRELAYWLSNLPSSAATLPTDFPQTMTASRLDAVATCALSEEETSALLHEVPSAYHTEIIDILLAAIAQTLTQWTGIDGVLIDLEAHGREPLFDDVDLSSTVGWFTTLFPLMLTPGAFTSQGDLLKALKEQMRSIPNHGIGYGLLRYLCDNQNSREQLRALPQPQIHFRYAGQFQRIAGSLLSVLDQQEPMMPTGKYLLAINAAIVEGVLEVGWWYSKHLYSPDTVEQLAKHFIEMLRSLIRHCQQQEAGGYTPSDFPLLDLGQQELDELLRDLEQ